MCVFICVYTSECVRNVPFCVCVCTRASGRVSMHGLGGGKLEEDSTRKHLSHHSLDRRWSIEIA